MSNGEFCCAIGLCCPPASASRRIALLSELRLGLPASRQALPPASLAAHQTGIDAALEHVTDWLIANVDMLPKGTIDMEKVAGVFQMQHGHGHEAPGQGNGAEHKPEP